MVTVATPDAARRVGLGEELDHPVVEGGDVVVDQLKADVLSLDGRQTTQLEQGESNKGS